MRRLIASGLGLATLSAVALTLLARPGPAPAQPVGQCTSGESVTAFGEWFNPGVQLEPLPAARRAAALVPPLSKPAVAMRLQISATAPPGQRWSVILRDRKLRILAILTEQDFQQQRTRWTGRLEANQASAELVGGGPGLRIAFNTGMALPQPGSGENVFSVQGSAPNWKDPYEEREEATYRSAAEAVGMLLTGAQLVENGVPRKAAWCCSGAMLTSDIYITNWHCGGGPGIPEQAYWNDQVCQNAVLDLGWTKVDPVRRQYQCRAVLHQNKRLDYVLLRVEPIIGPGAATGRAPPVRVSRELPAGPDVFMVHHAMCKPKLVSFSGCQIVNRNRRAWTDPDSVASGPEFTHHCDTEPGASGAPVFDPQGRMVGLHHLGFQKPGPQCPGDKLNKATTMAAILDDLQAAKPAVFAELSQP